MLSQVKQELINLIAKNPKAWHNVLRSTHRCIFTDIIAHVDPLFASASVATKVWCYLHDVHELPKCVICGKPLDTWTCNIHTGFSKTCSKACSNAYKHQQTEKACLKKHGVKNAFSLKTTHEKAQQTKLARHGDKNFNNPNKAAETCRRKYGVSNAAKTEDVKRKIQATCNAKFNCNCSFQADSVKASIKKTNLEHWGTENPFAAERVKEKIRHTMRDKYGVDAVGQLLSEGEFAEKRKQTCLAKYGHEFASQAECTKRQAERNASLKYGCKSKNTYFSYQAMLIDPDSSPEFTLQEYDARESDEVELKFRCKRCGKLFFARHADGLTGKCPTCFPKMASSELQLQLEQFVKRIFSGKVLMNIRDVIPPLELDVLIPEKKLAFEFDGQWWHSFDAGNKSKTYHIEKTRACEQLGIQLIHIFEGEWVNQRKIVESRIKALLGKHDHVIFARKCVVREVDPKISQKFQAECHLQQAVGAKVHLGLYLEDELVSLMTFGKPRFTRKADWELLRFCNKLGHHIPGGAGKLLRHFERNYMPKSIISYADRRWSRGKLYEALGFKLDHISGPNYWYFKNSLDLQSRVKFQKHKLQQLLEHFDPAESEMCNMIANGYHVIFDCGNLAFTKHYENFN